MNLHPASPSSQSQSPLAPADVEVVQYFAFTSMWQREGWTGPICAGVSADGIVRDLVTDAPAGAPVEHVEGFALPAFQNAHSHAFQYAMAGLAENHPTGLADDFWTWREEMYKCALTVDPDQAEAIAAMVYAEMVRVGYGHVAEFHYLHHDRNGKPYAHLAEMGERMVAAAATAGIKITLVPVFYQRGGFGMEPQERQRRFISKTVDDYLKLLDASAQIVKKYEHAMLGCSVHSLRAVEMDDICRTVEQSPKVPFHLHAAEQLKEISDCLAYTGQRPVQWVLDHLSIDSRFHVVHATHLDDAEVKGLAASGARVVLCPSTEGNLGDGIFRMKEFVKAGGRWSIGTDSHIGLNPLEELRMIDYRQRLLTHQRNTFEGDAAAYLINESVTSGRDAMGVRSSNHFGVGQPLDAVVYNAKSHLVAETSEKHRLATLLYTSDSSRLLGTIVDGAWVVRQQHHRRGENIKEAFSKAMRAIKNR